MGPGLRSEPDEIWPLCLGGYTGAFCKVASPAAQRREGKAKRIGVAKENKNETLAGADEAGFDPVDVFVGRSDGLAKKTRQRLDKDQTGHKMGKVTMEVQ
jgi:hypothetical protein